MINDEDDANADDIDVDDDNDDDVDGHFANDVNIMEQRNKYT